MKMLKRVFSLLLCLIFVAALVPAVTVAEAASYDIWVKGTQVTDEKLSNILGDGTVSYDPATNTLTVTGEPSTILVTASAP